MVTPGTYVLVLHLDRAARIEVGKLGTLSFAAGYYCYVGSARGPGGLRARLARHLRRPKRLHWHVDYLLRETSVEEIWTAPSSDRLECSWARDLLTLPGAQVSVRGFGSSDCSCQSHLVYVARSTLPTVRGQLRSLGATAWDRRHAAYKARDGQVP